MKRTPPDFYFLCPSRFGFIIYVAQLFFYTALWHMFYGCPIGTREEYFRTPLSFISMFTLINICWILWFIAEYFVPDRRLPKSRIPRTLVVVANIGVVVFLQLAVWKLDAVLFVD